LHLAEALERRTLLAFGLVGPEFRVNETIADSGGAGQVAMDAAGNFLVTFGINNFTTWTGTSYLRFFNANGQPRTGEIAMAGGATAMDADGDFVLVRSTGPSGHADGLVAQRFDAGGQPRGPEIPITSPPGTEVHSVDVAMDAGGGFVVTWVRLGLLPTAGAYARQFDAAGTAMGEEFRVSPDTEHGQSFPQVAMDRDGDFVIVWQTDDEDGSQIGVSAQRFTRGGARAGAEFQVNQFTKYDQQYPKVAMDADGDFVVVYEGYDGRDGPGFDVYARRYAASGAAKGDEFRVNTGSAGNIGVGMAAGGDFMVTFAKSDGPASDVYARGYTAGGVAGAELRVNTTTAGSQGNAVVAADADGDFVVVWQGNGPGDDSGIFAQRFTSRAGNGGGTPPDDGGSVPPDDGGGTPPDAGGNPPVDPGGGVDPGAVGEQPPPPAAQPPAPTTLWVTLSGPMPDTAMAGARAKVNQVVTVTSLVGYELKEPVTVKLYASTDTSLDAADRQVAEVTKTLRLKPLGAGVIKIKAADFPAMADGSYRLLARASSPTGVSASAAALSPVVVAAPSVDLSASFRAPLPARLTPGKKATVRLLVRQEAGNVAAKGAASVAVYASADGAAPSGAPIATAPVKLRLKPGGSRQYRLKFLVPEGLAPTPVFLAAILVPGSELSDANASNNTAATVTPIPVG
jgi:hypothetical protein